MNDPLDDIRDITPPVDPQPELLARVRSELMTTIEESNSHQRGAAGRGGRRARGRGVGLVAGAAAIVLMATATVWAVTRDSDSSDTTNLMCPGNAIVNAVTGDPVADCSNVWRQDNGSEPPSMAAYDNGSGGVAVVVVGEPVPEGYTALQPGTYQDTALIEVEAALGDIGTGLPSGCFDESEARAMVQDELDRLGMSSWDITVDESRQRDGIENCASSLMLPDQQAVQIFGSSGGGVGSYTEFAKALHAGLKAQCSNLDEAAELTRSIAASTPDYEVAGGETIAILDTLDIDSAVDPVASCTRVSVSVGGSLHVILRGPSA